MVTVRLDMKKDCFFAEFSNLGVGNVPIADEYPENLIACSVAVSGVLFSWIMRLKATITLVLRTLTGSRFVPNRKSKKIFLQLVSGS